MMALARITVIMGGLISFGKRGRALPSAGDDLPHLLVD
jgi:hypothetical protein